MLRDKPPHIGKILRKGNVELLEEYMHVESKKDEKAMGECHGQIVWFEWLRWYLRTWNEIQMNIMSNKVSGHISSTFMYKSYFGKNDVFGWNT